MIQVYLQAPSHSHDVQAAERNVRNLLLSLGPTSGAGELRVLVQDLQHLAQLLKDGTAQGDMIQVRLCEFIP